MNALRSALLAVARAAQCDGDPTGALHDTVEAIGTIAQRAAGEGALDAASRRELVAQAGRILSAIIRRGVASGAFRPPCTRWAIESLPHALVAGVCARWVFGLATERSLRAGAAADAALALLRPLVAPGAQEAPSMRGFGDAALRTYVRPKRSIRV